MDLRQSFHLLRSYSNLSSSSCSGELMEADVAAVRSLFLEKLSI